MTWPPSSPEPQKKPYLNCSGTVLDAPVSLTGVWPSHDVLTVPSLRLATHGCMTCDLGFQVAVLWCRLNGRSRSDDTRSPPCCNRLRWQRLTEALLPSNPDRPATASGTVARLGCWFRIVEKRIRRCCRRCVCRHGWHGYGFHRGLRHDRFHRNSGWVRRVFHHGCSATRVGCTVTTSVAATRSASRHRGTLQRRERSTRVAGHGSQTAKDSAHDGSHRMVHQTEEAASHVRDQRAAASTRIDAMDVASHISANSARIAGVAGMRRQSKSARITEPGRSANRCRDVAATATTVVAKNLAGQPAGRCGPAAWFG